MTGIINQRGEYAVKSQTKRNQFVILRAEGKSYSDIAAELGISKATCNKWETELRELVAEHKKKELEKLYDKYYMTREARIGKLGDTLAAINKALGAVDLRNTPPERLLDMKLKYTQALKDEYISTGQTSDIPAEITPAVLMEMLRDLLQRVRAGEVTTAQAKRESLILSDLLKAYEQTEIKAKLDQIEEMLADRETKDGV